MSGRMRLAKWTRLYQKTNFKMPTGKKLERIKQREKELMKRLLESDFHEITWTSQ